MDLRSSIEQVKADAAALTAERIRHDQAVMRGESPSDEHGPKIDSAPVNTPEGSDEDPGDRKRGR